LRKVTTSAKYKPQLASALATYSLRFHNLATYLINLESQTLHTYFLLFVAKDTDSNPPAKYQLQNSNFTEFFQIYKPHTKILDRKKVRYLAGPKTKTSDIYSNRKKVFYEDHLATAHRFNKVVTIA